ncbi:hypothetical protein TTHERM_00925370 (macronuclear) [Tetrahymena thermophila SB210]|uniref:Uncharacterized protein n=1 Tax=Tetrahymena thermophila (strain SB210) TaxID=312017 RepID=Q22E21_TETTS|nr:hypothetical protein TTHERM_00925370 [Tetrahymena thermophila SB210]EAR83491.2 hypothetical protein TTHERM_00925370 [Tetrahymena thermophila SB210]|eukprot:XP_001031154.2 hypothetical protein TTHERM_00925370 [Tetrahymena thermophila SB210]
MKEDFTSLETLKRDIKQEDISNIDREAYSSIEIIQSMLNLDKIEVTDSTLQQRNERLNGYNISFQDSATFIDQNEQVNFEFKRQVEPVMINQEEKLQEECSKYQEYNKSHNEEEEKQKDKATSRRSLRDSVMKQQMMGSLKSSVCKNNSMLQELKNIQLEKKSNKVTEREIPQNLTSLDNQAEQNQSNSNIQLSPSQSETSLYLNKYYVQGNLYSSTQHQNEYSHLTQVTNPDLTSQNKSDISKSISTQNLNNEVENDNNFVPNLNLNVFSEANQTLQDISNNNNDVNQNNANLDTKNSENATSPLSNSSLTQNRLKDLIQQNKKRSFIHKQILGVLEQEGYFVEVDNQTKLEEQLEILQAQRELVRQASIDFETSRDSSPQDVNDLSLEKQGSSSSKNKHRKRHNNQSSPNAHTPENFSPYKTNSGKQNKNIFKNICDNEQQLSGNKQILQTKSERFIPSPVLMKDIILDDYQVDTERRFSCNADSKSAKRNLLRQNVFHTNVISKTPNSSTSNGGTTSWNNVIVTQQQQEIQNDKINQNQNYNSEDHPQNHFALDNFLKQQKGSQQTKEKSPSSSSSSPSLSDQEDERRISQKSTETIKASCGGESTRNRSMRMNIGWNAVNTASNKSQNSSEGDDEDDNKSGNNTNKNSQMKLANQFKQLTKYGTMELDQDSDSGRKKADNKLNINLNEKQESNGDDEYEDRLYSQSVGQNSGYNSDEADNSGNGSMTSKSGQYISKFQKYYCNLNNNFQFDSIEEMESSQESIQKSSTKNSQRMKYPGTTRAMPKLDNPSNFLQYINMRKSKRQGSKIDQQNNSENLQSNMSSSQNQSPEIHFSGVFKYNDAMSDLNIDYTQSVKTSLCKSPVSPSKQLSLSQSNFHFSLNQVKYDEINTNMSQQIKRVESENDSPYSSEQQTPHSNKNNKLDTFSSEVPSMLKLPNSQSLISNYLASINKDFNNSNSINNNPAINTSQDLKSKVLSEDNQNRVIEPINSNQTKQQSENIQANLFQQIQLQQIPDLNLLVHEQKDQLKNSDNSNYIKDYLSSVSPKIKMDASISPKISPSQLGQNTNIQNTEIQEIVYTPQNDIKSEDKAHLSSSTQFINEYIKNLNSKSQHQMKDQLPQNEESHQKIVFPLRYDILNNNQQKEQYSNITEHLTGLLQPSFLSSKDIQISQTPREKSKTTNYLELQNFQNYSKSFVNSTSPINSLSSQQVSFNTFSQANSMQLNQNCSPSENSYQNYLPSSKYGEKPFSTLNTLNQQSASNSNSTNDRNLFSQYFTDKDSQSKQLQSSSSQSILSIQNQYQTKNQFTPLKTDFPQNKYANTVTSPLQNNQNSMQLNTNQAFGSSLLNNSSNPQLLNYSNPDLLTTQNVSTQNQHHLNTSNPHVLNASYPYSVNSLNPSSLNISPTHLTNSNIQSASITPLLKINEPLVNVSTAPLLISPNSQNSIQHLSDQHNSQLGTYSNTHYFISSKTELHSPLSTSNISKQGNLKNQSSKNLDDLYQHLDLVKEDSISYHPMVNSVLITNKNQSSSTQINSNTLSKSASNIYQNVQNTNENQFNLSQLAISNQENNNQNQNSQTNVQNVSTNFANNFTNQNVHNYFDSKYLQNLSENTPMSSSQNNYYLNLQNQTSLNQNVSPSNSLKNNQDNLSQNFFSNKQIQGQIKSYTSIQNNHNFQNSDNSYSNSYFMNSEDTLNKNNSTANNQISQSAQTNKIDTNYQNQYLGTSITTQISHTTSPYTTIKIQTKIETSIQNYNEKQPINSNSINNQSIVDQIMQEYRSKIQNQQSQQTEAKSLNNLPHEKEEDYSPNQDHQRNLTYSIPTANIYDFQKNSVQDQNNFSLNDKNFFYINSKDNNISNNSHINSSLDSVNKIYSALPSQSDFTHLENPSNENSNNNYQQNLSSINQKYNLQQ